MITAMVEPMHTPRKHKERQAKGSRNGPDVSFAHPVRGDPGHKTLIDIASERQLLNASSSSQQPSTTNFAIKPNSAISKIPESKTTPFLDIVLYASTLTLLHFTFTVLVHHQYATEPPSVVGLLYTSTVASPTPALLLVLVALLHPRASSIPIQVLFAAMSIFAGGWLVHTSNKDAYLATMKKAPSLGTLWIWAVVELRWEIALPCLGTVAGWGWWNGYSLI